MIHKFSFAYLRTFNIKISQILLCKTFLFWYVSVLQSRFFIIIIFRVSEQILFDVRSSNVGQLLKILIWIGKQKKVKTVRLSNGLNFASYPVFSRKWELFSVAKQCVTNSLLAPWRVLEFFRRGRLNFNRFTTSSGRKNKLCIYAGSDHKTLTK